MVEALRLSSDHRTAWRYAYNVYRGRDHLGLVYRDSDDRWHVIHADAGRFQTTWGTRKEAVAGLIEGRAR